MVKSGQRSRMPYCLCSVGACNKLSLFGQAETCLSCNFTFNHKSSTDISIVFFAHLKYQDWCWIERGPKGVWAWGEPTEQCECRRMDTFENLRREWQLEIFPKIRWSPVEKLSFNYPSGIMTGTWIKTWKEWLYFLKHRYSTKSWQFYEINQCKINISIKYHYFNLYI